MNYVCPRCHSGFHLSPPDFDGSSYCSQCDLSFTPQDEGWKTARVSIVVTKSYTIDVLIPPGKDATYAEMATWDIQSTWIQENGTLNNVDTDHSEFQRWVEE